jgi:hypothetical protein
VSSNPLILHLNVDYTSSCQTKTDLFSPQCDKGTIKDLRDNSTQKISTKHGPKIIEKLSLVISRVHVKLSTI